MQGSVINIEEVYDQIKDLLILKLNVNPLHIIKKNYDEPLTGKIFHLNAMELTYLFFEIERFFQIRIMPQDILNKEFNSIHGIAEVIIEYI